jgi:mycothiol synthase
MDRILKPLSDFTWRPIQIADRKILTDLDSSCRAADGVEFVSDLPGDAINSASAWPENTRCALRKNDLALAAGIWIMPSDGNLYRIGGRVHPDYRRMALGSHMLGWVENRLLQNPELHGSIRLEITNEALTPGAEALYSSMGYSQIMAEDMLVRKSSQDFADSPLPGGLTLMSWNEDTQAVFFQAFQFSFRDRPGFPDLAALEWIEELRKDKDFLPDSSFLAMDNDQPAGFVTSGLMGGMGWINQIGVEPAWRGKGLGKALLTLVLQRFQILGMEQVGLHVNVNNPAATRLYTGFGFSPRLRRARYIKTLKINPGSR